MIKGKHSQSFSRIGGMEIYTHSNNALVDIISIHYDSDRKDGIFAVDEDILLKNVSDIVIEMTNEKEEKLTLKFTGVQIIEKYRKNIYSFTFDSLL